MAGVLWRRFPFFDKSTVSDPDDPDQDFVFEEGSQVVTASSGHGDLILGDAKGLVHVVGRNFRSWAFRAYTGRLAQVVQMKTSDVLYTIGYNENPTEPILRVWKRERSSTTTARTNLGDHAKGNNGSTSPDHAAPTSPPMSAPHEPPPLLKEIKLNTPSKSSSVTTLEVLENLTKLAIGLDDGSVILVSGDLTRDRYPTQRIVLETEFPVTGLGFTTDNKRGTVHLFCVTTDSIYLLDVTNVKNKGTIPIGLMEEQGCGLNCATISNTGSMVMARPECVYFYEDMGRGAAFVFEGQKKIVKWLRNYLVIVSPSKQSQPSTARPAPGPGGASARSGAQAMDTITIYDIPNKFIAFAGLVPVLSEVLSEMGQVLLLTKDGRFIRLTEKDTQTKLEILFKKNLYPLAINLAVSAHQAEDQIMDIHREYGDHLYNKGDFDGGIEQYVRTIGHLEPSYVIRKFLDAQRLANLTAYLQALHTHPLALSLVTADHTTLLLNCYTKLKDVQHLDEFIMSDKDISFDIETAIKVCRSAGYHRHSLHLAKKYHRIDWYLKLQLEDLHGYKDALYYISTLDFVLAEEYVKKYGNTLISAAPAGTCLLLSKLCLGYEPVTPPPKDSANRSGTNSPMHNQLTSRSSVLAGLGHGLGALGLNVSPIPRRGSKTRRSNSASSYTSTNNSRNGTPTGSSTNLHQLRRSPAASRPCPTTSKAPLPKSEPERFLHIFVKSTGWLLVFLEYIINRQKQSSTVLYNTLIELYLRDDVPSRPALDSKEVLALARIEGDADVLENTRNGTDKAKDKDTMLVTRKDTVLHLLQDPDANYDLDHAMVLMQMYSFNPGVIYLFEKAKLYTNIIQDYMEKEEYGQVIAKAQKYGTQDPSIWILVLIYFSNRTDNCGQEIAEVLTNIDRYNLLPPLVVLNVLGKNRAMSLSVVKTYINQRLQQEKSGIDEDGAVIQQYRTEIERMQKEIAELTSAPKVIQRRRCTACGRELQLPVVHFLCEHSFHQACLGDDRVCPNCAPETRKVAEMMRMRESKDNSEKQEQFFKQLEGAKDGFAVVAEYYGKGIFDTNNPKNARRRSKASI